MKVAVIAVGGNALVTDNAHATIADQATAARSLASVLASIVRDGWRITLTHGNGPQAGFILRRSELVAELAPDIPQIGLDIAVADSQGGIGHILAAALLSELALEARGPQVAALITHVIVDPLEVSFTRPTKPIGGWMSRQEAMRSAREYGWHMAEEPDRGWRRLVPSPRPLRVVEAAAAALLLDHGFLVIAGGGGGIPLACANEDGYRGVEAVVDKDHTSALLAVELGADLLVLTTGVDQVCIDYGQPTEHPITSMTIDEAGTYFADGQFPAGSMGPKIEASISYLRARDGQVLITSPARLADALAGSSGTRITR